MQYLNHSLGLTLLNPGLVYCFECFELLYAILINMYVKPQKIKI